VAKPCNCNDKKGDDVMPKKGTGSKTGKDEYSAGLGNRMSTIATRSTRMVPSAVAEAAMSSMADRAVANQTMVAKLWEKTRDQNSTPHKAATDIGGSLLGVVSFEGINWMVRYLGDKFPLIGDSVDYMQSLPHLIIGIVAYWGELLTRRKPTKDGPPSWPSMPREIASEWAKVFILLGAANLLRALRLRRKDSKLAADELLAIKAELSQARAQLAKLAK